MLDYKVVKYHGKNYCVCRYKYKGKNKLYVIDASDFGKMTAHSESWYDTNGYISYTRIKNNKKTTYYLQNIIKGRMGGGKGQRHVYDHISRNKRDNRKANLEFVTKSEYKKRKRTIKLPKGCGVKACDLPKCVYYCKPQSNHGDMFVIELKQRGGKKKIWKSSSSSGKSTKDKFIETKELLLQIKRKYPELIKKNLLENYSEGAIKLMKEFNDIIKRSKYQCTKSNLMKIPIRQVIKSSLQKAGAMTKKYLKTTNIVKRNGKMHRNTLPKRCGITPDMIPKYCYYQAETEKRGDAFVIDRHPGLPKGKRQWRTTGIRDVTVQEKFRELKKKLREIGKKKRAGSKTAKKK